MSQNWKTARKQTNKQTKNKIVVFKDQDWALLCSLSLSFWLPYFAKLINAFLVSLSVWKLKKERNKRKQLALWTETGRQRDDWDGKDVRSPLSLSALWWAPFILAESNLYVKLTSLHRPASDVLTGAPQLHWQLYSAITQLHRAEQSSSHCHAALTSFYHRVCLHASTVSM